MDIRNPFAPHASDLVPSLDGRDNGAKATTPQSGQPPAPSPRSLYELGVIPTWSSSGHGLHTRPDLRASGETWSQTVKYGKTWPVRQAEGSPPGVAARAASAGPDNATRARQDAEPGVAKGPVSASIATWVKRERVADWLAKQSSTRTDKEVLEQAKSHLSTDNKTVLRSLARWFRKTYEQTDKLDCIQKNADPKIKDLIIELYKSDTDSKFYKERINLTIMRLQSGTKIERNRNLDEQLHADDKPAIDIIKQYFPHASTISTFRQFAIWEREQPQPVGLAQIIANPAYQAHSKRLLTEFFNDKEIKPDYIAKAIRLIPKAQGNDALKQALSKLLS